MDETADGTPDRGYFDTSALMRWVEADATPPRDINTRIGAAVEAIVQSGERLGLSELTLLEFRAAVSRNWREKQPQSAAYDAPWANAARLKVLTPVASGRFEVVATPLRATEQAMSLVDMAARDHLLPLGTWDAIHLITAAAWAQSDGERVNLYTSDDDYDDFVDRYPHFRTFVEIVNLDHRTAQP